MEPAVRERGGEVLATKGLVPVRGCELGGVSDVTRSEVSSLSPARIVIVRGDLVRLRRCSCFEVK